MNRQPLYNPVVPLIHRWHISPQLGGAMPTSGCGPVYEFSNFRLDCGRFELLRNSRSLRVERKPMELLILLASRKGQLVTRTEIAERLWEREVFVDTEHGINTAIRKIRYILRDDPDDPRFIQTVTGMGYRFVAPVAVLNGGDGKTSQVEDDVEESENEQTAMEAAEVAAEAVPIAANEKRSLGPWLGWTIAEILLVVGVGVTARFWTHRAHAATASIHSLAVLPLDNLSGDPEQNYFADGMTDELTTMLARDSTLRIVSRTSAMQYKGVHKPLREIARELGVDGIVEGSVERSGDDVHMTLQLIQGSSDTHVWADSYDRDAKDAFSLSDDAAMEIARKTNSAAAGHVSARYVSPEAHDAYLHGRYLWFAERNDEAEKYFVKAAAIQPDYALAWTGIADYYAAGMIVGTLDPRGAREPLETAAEKAVELDGSSAQAHNTLCAAIFFSRWDLTGADKECQRAIDLDPEFAEAYHLRAKVLLSMGRYEEAIASQKKAMELDPFARPWGLAYIYMLARQYDAALTEGKQRLESDPHNAWTLYILADICRRKGMRAEAVDYLAEGMIADGDQADAASIRRAFERGGYRAVVLWSVENMKRESEKRYVSPVNMALLYAQLGDREETLRLLEEGYQQRSPQLLDLQSDPAYDFLHSDPRYRSLIQRIGLPQTY